MIIGKEKAAKEKEVLNAEIEHTDQLSEEELDTLLGPSSWDEILDEDDDDDITNSDYMSDIFEDSDDAYLDDITDGVFGSIFD